MSRIIDIFARFKASVLPSNLVCLFLRTFLRILDSVIVSGKSNLKEVHREGFYGNTSRCQDIQGHITITRLIRYQYLTLFENKIYYKNYIVVIIVI